MIHRHSKPRLHAPLSVALLAAAACTPKPTAPAPTTVRLVERFKPEVLQGEAPPARDLPRTEWRFDGPEPTLAPKELAATRGWRAGINVSWLEVRNGRLAGRATTDFPILSVERTTALDSRDQVHGFEIRMSVSSGANLAMTTRDASLLDFASIEKVAKGRVPPWSITTPILPGPEPRTYTLTSPAPLNLSRVRHILIRPTDAADATFEIESLRVVTRREYLASLESGVGWQGLAEIYRETLVGRAPQSLRFDLTLPERAWLDVALGTVDDQPPTFRIALEVDGGAPERVLLDQPVTTPYRWETQALDLTEFGGQRVALTLSLAGSEPGAIGFWGAPVVRTRPEFSDAAPQGIILIQADTLRADHLGLYGHSRETAPFLRKASSEGVVFRNAVAQAGWTKVSTPSFLTSLYPSTHGVFRFDDRLPASATTIAEVYRDAGYATLSLTSASFTGQHTNLHQGYEELHEASSLLDAAPPFNAKTAREHVDRAVAWIERHRDVPFFVYLHVFDPHPPYEPRQPYDALWADPSQRDEHIRQRDELRKAIAEPFLADRGMATRDEMVKAGVDPAAYLSYDKDWYDSSIRSLDVELARLFARLRAMGLDRNTAMVFLSDHGEEFHEHGRMWHGQSVYGEMMRVPLIVRWPAGATAGRVIDEPVQLIDVMPTLLDLSDLPHPAGLQGQSLEPFLCADAGTGGRWKRRPVFMEKQPQGGPDFPSKLEAYAISDGEWKLVHNMVRPPDRPEFELFEFQRDPLDQRDLASQHPEVVQRLAAALDGWHTTAVAARLEADADKANALSAEDLQRLRSLGYIR